MIIKIKAALGMYYPSLMTTNPYGCNLRVQDPDFNKGHGKRFYNALERAIARGDFK